MKPEIQDSLNKSRYLLAQSQLLMDHGHVEAAGRTFYLASYHAAQAYIFSKTGKIVKTHKGTHHLFFELTENEPSLSRQLRAFLSKAYELKAIADYEIGPAATLPAEYVSEEMKTAIELIDRIESILRVSDGS